MTFSNKFWKKVSTRNWFWPVSNAKTTAFTSVSLEMNTEQMNEQSSWSCSRYLQHLQICASKRFGHEVLALPGNHHLPEILQSLNTLFDIGASKTHRIGYMKWSLLTRNLRSPLMICCRAFLMRYRCRPRTMLEKERWVIRLILLLDKKVSRLLRNVLRFQHLIVF